MWGLPENKWMKMWKLIGLSRRIHYPQGSEWRIRPWRSYLTLDVSISPRTLGVLDSALNSIINNKRWPSPRPLLPLSILSPRHAIKIYFTFLLLSSQGKGDRICITHFYTNLSVLLTAADSLPPSNICVYVAVKQWHWNNTLEIIYSNPAGIAVYLLTPGNYFDGNPFGWCSSRGWGYAVSSQREGRSSTSAPLRVVSEWPLGHGGSLGIFRAGCSWDHRAGCRMSAGTRSLGWWTWGWALDHPAWWRISSFAHRFLHILWTGQSQPHARPCWAHGHPPHTSPDTNPPSPPHLNSQEELRPSLCRTILFSGSSPGPFPREMPTPPNTPRELHPKLPLFSVFSHSALTGGAGGAGWRWLSWKLPFSLSANSAGFLSMESICERASFSRSPFKATAIGNIWGM